MPNFAAELKASRKPYGQIARRVTIPPNGVMQVIGEDFGDEPITLRFQNFHAAPAPPVPVLEINAEVAGGYDAGSLIQTAIGPGEATRFRVTGQTRVTVRNISGVAVDLGFWTDNTIDQLKIPMTSGAIALGAGIWTTLPPAGGFAPAYKRWFTINIASGFDLRFLDFTGAVTVTHVGLPAPAIQTLPILLPARHSVEINVAVGVNVICNWTENREG